MLNQVEDQVSNLINRTTPVTWLFTGDSITSGEKHTHGFRDYTELFKERMCEMGRIEDVVINTASSGKSGDWCARRIEERVLRFCPDAVFLMFGTNDAGEGREGLAPYRRAMTQIINDLRRSLVSLIVLQTPVCMYPFHADNSAGRVGSSDAIGNQKCLGEQLRQQYLDLYMRETRALSEENNLILTDHWQVWSGTNTGESDQLFSSGFHPNEYGHRLLAHTLFKRLGVWNPSSWTCRLFAPVKN